LPYRISAPELSEAIDSAAIALVPGGFTAFADWAKVHMCRPGGDAAVLRVRREEAMARRERKRDVSPP
jgi:hypothetical protein